MLFMQIKVKSCYADSEASVVCCDGLELDEKGYLIASASGDSHVRIYQTERGIKMLISDFMILFFSCLRIDRHFCFFFVVLPKA